MLARGLGIIVVSKNEKRGPKIQQLSDSLKLLMCYLQISLEICELSNLNRNSGNANLPFHLSLKLFYSRFVVEKIYQQRNQQIAKLGVHSLFSQVLATPISYQNSVCSTTHNVLSLKYSCDFEVTWLFHLKAIRMK